MRYWTMMFAAAAVCAAPVIADETWSSDMGQIIYEDDVDGAAVFSFTNVDGSRAVVVIRGVEENYDDRGVHDGFWIGQGAGYCIGAMSIGGQPSYQWGRALISFETPAFPSSFTMTLGDCFDPFHYSIRATAN